MDCSLTLSVLNDAPDAPTRLRAYAPDAPNIFTRLTRLIRAQGFLRAQRAQYFYAPNAPHTRPKFLTRLTRPKFLTRLTRPKVLTRLTRPKCLTRLRHPKFLTRPKSKFILDFIYTSNILHAQYFRHSKSG